MQQEKVKPGVYRVFWKSGGSSLASIGMTEDGERWIAPINWVVPAVKTAGSPKQSAWGDVDRLQAIEIENSHTEIPVGFVIRECGCVYYHCGLDMGYLLVLCEVKGTVSVEGSQALPKDKPYTVADAVAVAKIFEKLRKKCLQANVGLQFLETLEQAKRLDDWAC